MKQKIKSLSSAHILNSIRPGDNITVSEVAEATPEFWAAVAIGALRNNTIMTNLVNRDYDTIVAQRGDTINITKRGVLSVNDKTANNPITLQTPSNTKLPVTLDKHKEISWLIEDVASANAIKDAVAYITDAAIAMAEQIDKDLLALYSGVGTSVSAGGVHITPDIIVDARGALNDLLCPTRGRSIVMSSKDESNLLKQEKFTSASWDGINVQALREGFITRKFGFDMFMDQLVKTSGASPTVYHNLAFHRDAFVLVTRPLPQAPEGRGVTMAILVIDGVALRISNSYSQTYGGMLWTLDVLYGVAGMRDDTHAVDILS